MALAMLRFFLFLVSFRGLQDERHVAHKRDNIL